MRGSNRRLSTWGLPQVRPQYRFYFSYCPSNPCTNNGNVLTQGSVPLNATDTYTYDTTNRILTGSEGTAWSQTYVYDRFGNRTVVAGSFVPNSNSTPQVPNSSSALPYTNNRWNRATFDSATVSGSLTALNGFAYTYDAENRRQKSCRRREGPSFRRS